MKSILTITLIFLLSPLAQAELLNRVEIRKIEQETRPRNGEYKVHVNHFAGGCTKYLGLLLETIGVSAVGGARIEVRAVAQPSSDPKCRQGGSFTTDTFTVPVSTGPYEFIAVQP
jgi:hypothetical protein